ncbi:MAG: aminotransferase class V-fold PLP-dependent enzyme, partial [Polyangiales bacterium]
REEGLDALEQELSKGLRLVAVSAVQYKTGLRMPIQSMAELCHRYDAELFVDAIQAVGATPVDVTWGIDYLSSGSHKHLMGPEGAGFLYVSERCAEACHPRLAGWLSHQDAVDFLVGDEAVLRYDKPLNAGAGAFEIGTLNALGLCALGASVDLLREFDLGEVHRHVNGYLDSLEVGLVERGFESFRTAAPEGRSTLLSVRTPDDAPPTRLAAALSRRGVVCNTPDGLVRFAPHWPNHLGEVPDVLASVDAALADLRG